MNRSALIVALLGLAIMTLPGATAWSLDEGVLIGAAETHDSCALIVCNVCPPLPQVVCSVGGNDVEGALVLRGKL